MGAGDAVASQDLADRLGGEADETRIGVIRKVPLQKPNRLVGERCESRFVGLRFLD